CGRPRPRADRSGAAAQARRPAVFAPAAGKGASVRRRKRSGAAMRDRDAAGKTSVASALASRARGIRVICLGLSALDQVWRVEGLFAGGSEKIRGFDYATVCGGMAANAAVAVARLGGTTAFWGRGGDDTAGPQKGAGAFRGDNDVRPFFPFPLRRSALFRVTA